MRVPRDAAFTIQTTMTDFLVRSPSSSWHQDAAPWQADVLVLLQTEKMTCHKAKNHGSNLYWGLTSNQRIPEREEK